MQEEITSNWRPNIESSQRLAFASSDLAPFACAANSSESIVRVHGLASRHWPTPDGQCFAGTGQRVPGGVSRTQCQARTAPLVLLLIQV
jgi:hypothetical protein